MKQKEFRFTYRKKSYRIRIPQNLRSNALWWKKSGKSNELINRYIAM